MWCKPREAPPWGAGEGASWRTWLASEGVSGTRFLPKCEVPGRSRASSPASWQLQGGRTGSELSLRKAAAWREVSVGANELVEPSGAGPQAFSEAGEGAPRCVSTSGPHNSPSLRPRGQPPRRGVALLPGPGALLLHPHEIHPRQARSARQGLGVQGGRELRAPRPRRRGWGGGREGSPALAGPAAPRARLQAPRARRSST